MQHKGLGIAACAVRKGHSFSRLCSLCFAAPKSRRVGAARCGRRKKAALLGSLLQTAIGHIPFLFGIHQLVQHGAVWRSEREGSAAAGKVKRRVKAGFVGTVKAIGIHHQILPGGKNVFRKHPGIGIPRLVGQARALERNRLLGGIVQLHPVHRLSVLPLQAAQVFGHDLVDAHRAAAFGIGLPGQADQTNQKQRRRGQHGQYARQPPLILLFTTQSTHTLLLSFLISRSLRRNRIQN